MATFVLETVERPEYACFFLAIFVVEIVEDEDFSHVGTLEVSVDI